MPCLTGPYPVGIYTIYTPIGLMTPYDLEIMGVHRRKQHIITVCNLSTSPATTEFQLKG